MPQIITDTALLQCSQGTVTTSLAVTSQNFCVIDKKIVATEADKQTGTNIKPFGDCRLKPKTGGFQPCNPFLIAWQNTSAKNNIKGSRLLLETSTCPCAIGGTLSVKDKGHKSNQEAV